MIFRYSPIKLLFSQSKMVSRLIQQIIKFFLHKTDEIPPEEVQRRFEIFMRIPTEVWTDILKILPRSILVQQIAPICFRLKEISDKNVKNIHVIKDAKQLDYECEWISITKKQLKHLTGNKCQLAGQFRLTRLCISDEKSQVIVSCCPDLFNGCQIHLSFEDENKKPTLVLGCLGQLEKAKPVLIYVEQQVAQVVDFWHNPTFQNCTRVHLHFWSPLADATLMTVSENIFDWLHHQPIGGRDCGGSAAQQIRCMIVWFSKHHKQHIHSLLNRCSENFRNSHGPADRRQFVLSFDCLDWSGFGRFRRIKNKSTGEVLKIERKMHANGRATHQYRLRRCLAKEEANGPVFYAEMFRHDYGYDKFKMDEVARPEVILYDNETIWEEDIMVMEKIIDFLFKFDFIKSYLF